VANAELRVDQRLRHAAMQTVTQVRLVCPKMIPGSAWGVNSTSPVLTSVVSMDLGLVLVAPSPSLHVKATWERRWSRFSAPSDIKSLATRKQRQDALFLLPRAWVPSLCCIFFRPACFRRDNPRQPHRTDHSHTLWWHICFFFYCRQMPKRNNKMTLWIASYR
jgi:hypothetical protein